MGDLKIIVMTLTLLDFQVLQQGRFGVDGKAVLLHVAKWYKIERH